jgi:hypothetical protein
MYVICVHDMQQTCTACNTLNIHPVQHKSIASAPALPDTIKKFKTTNKAKGVPQILEVLAAQ